MRIPHPRIKFSGLILALCVAQWAAHVAQAQRGPGHGPGFGSTLRAVSATRTDQPISIDGLTIEPAWANAQVIDAFTQVAPHEGAPPSERTEVRVLYDDDAIYISARCFDSAPEAIVATQMQRDLDQRADDHFMVVLDTFDNSRDGYFFATNANGVRQDGLVELGERINTDWDTIWFAAATIDQDEGWTCEIKIPFKSLSFRPDGAAWGINFQRIIRRNNETVRWSTPVRNFGVSTLAGAGVLEGLEGMHQGLGLDVKPYFTSLIRSGDEVQERERTRGGLDVTYRITPNLTAAFTWNTDFAFTEVDARQINLTRFPLFFPEKRDFFLQDAGLFRFGGINQSPLPFHSRRIGIGPGGAPIDLIYGGKLTGRIDDLNVGLLAVQQEAYDGVPEKTLTVGRFSLNVLDESSLGVIFTHGDPTADANNALVGLDFNYRNSKDFGSDVLSAALFGQLSQSSDAEGDQSAIGGRVNYDSDVFDWSVFFAQVGKDYHPAIGFVSRPGEREHDVRMRYRIRPRGAIDRIDFSANASWYTDLAGRLNTLELRLPSISVVTEAGDWFEIESHILEERLPEDFEIADGVVIPKGIYTWNRYSVEVGSGNGRPFDLLFGAEVGDFYDGHRFDRWVRAAWRPSKHFNTSVAYNQSNVDLPGGEFQTEIASMRLDAAFTPDLSWANFIQYDNFSSTVGINSRLRWTLQPGQDIFVVLNQSFDAERRSVALVGTDLTLKVVLTLRF
ncbi:MAG: carbohydrate binding family 9 domain-containing protein [Phycisphaerales bacterium]|nr:carbohydrate binding family 9 domain-containing protein [Phycisphaerales bacterium]